MKLRSRLKLSAFLGICGLIGLAVLFYLYLPRQADELIRRQAEDNLERLADRLDSDIASLGAPARMSLAALIQDTRVREMDIETEEAAKDPGLKVDLAKKLCARYEIDNLILIDNTGVQHSLHPEAARVGMKNMAWLETARQAAIAPVFIHVNADGRPRLKPSEPELGQATAEAERDETKALFALIIAEPTETGRLFAVTAQAISRAEIAHLAAINAMQLDEVSTAGMGSPEIKEKPGQRIVAIKSPDGARVATFALHSVGRSGTIIRRLLLRNILILAAPWVLFFCFLILWVAWPKKSDRKLKD